MFQRVGVLEQAAVVQEQVQCEVQRLREGGPGGRAGQHRQHRQVGPLLCECNTAYMIATAIWRRS